MADLGKIKGLLLLYIFFKRRIIINITTGGSGPPRLLGPATISRKIKIQVLALKSHPSITKISPTKHHKTYDIPDIAHTDIYRVAS